MNNIFLLEDHDEALRVWRQKNIKNLDLVHLDAHIDFGFHPARPIEKVIDEARSLNELKRNLEYSIAFMHFEKNFDSQTNIGNYIYHAMKEGVVRNFYWVIPGGIKEFKESYKFIKGLLKGLTKVKEWKIEFKEEGIISTKFLGRNLTFTILEKLPILREKVLLDIDTDFLVINSLLKANRTAEIGKRIPWILPKDLVEILKNRIKQPQIITIAYSVNGGWTPIKYRHLGDEIAYRFSPLEFEWHFKMGQRAAKYFNLFVSTGENEYYRNAVRLNFRYRATDNNYGPLYFCLRKFSLAKKEFLKIQKADPKNPACLWGLGNIALEKKDFRIAKRYFSYIDKVRINHLFKDIKISSLFGLGKAEFKLKNFKKAKRLLFLYKRKKPLDANAHYLLGRIFENEKKYPKASVFYKEAGSLGFDILELIYRLLNLALKLKDNDAIIKHAVEKYKGFKKWFICAKNLKLKRAKKPKITNKIREKVSAIEKLLNKILDNYCIIWYVYLGGGKMEKIAFTTKLEKEQVEMLKEISEKTHIPQSVLVREWINKGIKEKLGIVKKSNINDDSIVKLKGLFDGDKDLSVNHDRYLYGKRGKV